MNNFNKERNACFGVAFLLMFMIGIYFVHIPWNIDRLNITESQLGFGIFIFGIFNFFSNQMSGRVVVPRIGTTRTIILGIIIFGTYGFTLAAVYGKYPITTALAETTWGAVLFILTTVISYFIIKKIDNK